MENNNSINNNSGNKEDTTISNQNNVKNEAKDYDNDANISLIVGILSLVLSATPIVNIVLAIIAIVKAKKIPKDQRTGKAIAGMVMGIITIIISVVIFIILLVLVIGFGVFIYDIAENTSQDYNYDAYSNISNSIISNFSNEYQPKREENGDNSSKSDNKSPEDHINDIYDLYEVTEDEAKTIIENLNMTREDGSSLSSNDVVLKNKENNMTYILPAR